MTNKELLDKYGIKDPPCGCYIPAGWMKLVEQLVIDMIAAGWDKDLHQAKEKFGGLRFYIGSASDKVHDLIHEAENKSLTMCYECGEDVRTSTNKCCTKNGHWI